MQHRLHKQNLFIILLLGFSSGLPLALTTSTLQAWFTVTGANILTVASLGLIGQPYIYKFLWAPLLDRWTLPFLERRRGWMIITQIALMFTLIGIIFVDPKTTPSLLITLSLLVAIFSASQDIAIDAYRTDLLEPYERGIGATLTTWGYRVGMLVSGAFGLLLAEKFGWHAMYFIMASLMIIGLLASYFGRNPTSVCQQKNLAPPSLHIAIIEPFKEFLSRKSAWLILLLIILYKFGDALSVSLTTPFLIRGLNFSLTTVAFVNKGIGFFATMLGLLVGGLIMTHIDLLKALFYFGLLQAIAILTLLQLALVGHHYGLLILAIFTDNFCNAMGSIAFISFIMSLCDKRYTATQFALFSALSSVGRVLVGPLAGLIATYFSWPTFFILSLAACAPGLVLLWYLRDSINRTTLLVKEAS